MPPTRRPSSEGGVAESVKKEQNDELDSSDEVLRQIDYDLQYDNRYKEFRCLPCGTIEDEYYNQPSPIQCDLCRTWQHRRCYFGSDDANVPNSYNCNVCESNPKKYRHLPAAISVEDFLNSQVRGARNRRPNRDIEIPPSSSGASPRTRSFRSLNKSESISSSNSRKKSTITAPSTTISRENIKRRIMQSDSESEEEEEQISESQNEEPSSSEEESDSEEDDEKDSDFEERQPTRRNNIRSNSTSLASRKPDRISVTSSSKILTSVTPKKKDTKRPIKSENTSNIIPSSSVKPQTVSTQTAKPRIEDTRTTERSSRSVNDVLDLGFALNSDHNEEEDPLGRDKCSNSTSTNSRLMNNNNNIQTSAIPTPKPVPKTPAPKANFRPKRHLIIGTNQNITPTVVRRGIVAPSLNHQNNKLISESVAGSGSPSEKKAVESSSSFKRTSSALEPKSINSSTNNKKARSTDTSEPVSLSAEEIRKAALKQAIDIFDYVFMTNENQEKLHFKPKNLQNTSSINKKRDSSDYIQVPGSEEDEDINETIIKWAKSLESALFEAYQYRPTNQPTSQYREALRRVYHNLRDYYNKDLRKSVISGEIKLEKLIRMSNTELSNPMLKRRRSKDIHQSLTNTTVLERVSIGAIRKTHKGDLIKEDEDRVLDHDHEPYVEAEVNHGGTAYGAGGTVHDVTIGTAYGGGGNNLVSTAYGNGNETSYGDRSAYIGTAYGGGDGGYTTYGDFTAYGTAYDGAATGKGAIQLGELVFQSQLTFVELVSYQIKAFCCLTNNLVSPRREMVLESLADYTSELTIDRRAKIADSEKYISDLIKHKHSLVILEIRPSNKEKKQLKGFYQTFDRINNEKKFGSVKFNKDDLKEVKSVFLFAVKDEMPVFMTKCLQQQQKITNRCINVTIDENPTHRRRRMFLVYCIKPKSDPRKSSLSKGSSISSSTSASTTNEQPISGSIQIANNTSLINEQPISGSIQVANNTSLINEQPLQYMEQDQNFQNGHDQYQYQTTTNGDYMTEQNFTQEYPTSYTHINVQEQNQIVQSLLDKLQFDESARQVQDFSSYESTFRQSLNVSESALLDDVILNNENARWDLSLICHDLSVGYFIAIY